jgi:DNA replication protein DnaC
VTQQRLSQNPEEKTWTCPTCGVMPPFILGNGWYARRHCACERQAEAARQAQGVPRTLAQALAQAQLKQTYSWLGKQWTETAMENKTFDTFDRARQSHAYEQARVFAMHPRGILALYGSYGLGKTHLLAAIANARTVAGEVSLFVSATTLFDAIQDRIAHEQDYHHLIRRALTTPLLLLDDLDKPKPSEFRQEMYYQIIDGRTRASLPLAISCNGTPADLERFVGGATRSRLMMGIIPVSMSGMDYRLEMRP